MSEESKPTVAAAAAPPAEAKPAEGRPAGGAAAAAAAVAAAMAAKAAKAGAAGAGAAKPAAHAAHPKPAGRPTVTIGPGNIDGRWHFAPVDCVIEQKGEEWTIGSNDTPTVGQGPTKKDAFRAWMVETVKRYLVLQKKGPAALTPDEAKEWKWMEKNIVRA
jgi:hypothetical protein